MQQRASEDEKLFEQAMFELTQAVDKGNLVIYAEAVDQALDKLKKRNRHKEATSVDKEAPVQGMRLIYK